MIEKKIFTIGFLCVFFSCSMSDRTEKLGNNYVFVGEGGGNEFIVRSGDNYRNNVIPCTIVSYNFNEQFIIAAQKPNSNCLIEENDTESLNFWIIDNRSNKIFGPMTINQYLEKRKILEVDKNLVLEIRI